MGASPSLSELPSDKILIAYIKEAVKLNEEKASQPASPTTKKPAAKAKKKLVVPKVLAAALKKNKKGAGHFR